MTLRWGLLSTAHINYKLIPAIRAAARSELIAVASRTASSAESYAAKWEIPQPFASYEAMLAANDIDAVYISLPHSMHAEWTVKALDAGKHVLCEKPFAMSVAEVDDMIAASERNGRVLTEAFMYRHHPQTRIIGQWISDGRLGDVRLVQSVFSFKLDDPANIRLNSELGGGSLWDVGVYPVSLAQYVYGGAPDQVSGIQFIGQSGVEEFFSGQLDFGQGRMAQISSSLKSPFHSSATILGSKGRLEVTRPFTGMEDAGQLTFVGTDLERQPIPVPAQELYIGEVEDMEAAALDGTTQYLSLRESRDHVATVTALYQSAESGRPVKL